MVSNKSTISAWIVVEVHSGIPVEVKAFSKPETAIEYCKSVREIINLDNDETGVFEVNLPVD